MVSGRARETDLSFSTLWTSRSTSRSACAIGTSAARRWRCASARTCQICQVERRSSIADSTRSAAVSSQAASSSRAVDGHGAERLAHHELHGVWPAQHVGGLGEPCLSLFGEAAWLVLGLPGFQGGLLGQLQRFDRGGWAAVGALEVCGKHGPPGFDGGSTGRPPGGQGGVDADDFSYRPFPRVLVRPFGESEAETVAEVLL